MTRLVSDCNFCRQNELRRRRGSRVNALLMRIVRQVTPVLGARAADQPLALLQKPTARSRKVRERGSLTMNISSSAPIASVTSQESLLMSLNRG